MTYQQPDVKGFYGKFGGQFVPETLMTAVIELDKAYREAKEEMCIRDSSSYYLRDVIAISTLNSYTLPIYLVAMAICTPLFFWISYKQGAFQKAQSKT